VKILVTGSSGFLGTALCRFLEERGHLLTKLTSKNCDLTQPVKMNSLINEKFDFLFHLAAWTQAGDFCIKHPGDQWIINQKINTHVLDWWASEQPQAKLIFMGTSCVYSPGSSLSETDYMVGEPIDSLYTYAMTKRMLYQGARALSKQYGLRYLCAVPSTLYGPGYHTDGRQMHFIFDLIRKIIRGKEYGESVVLWGNGYQKRELVFVDDFVKILWSIAGRFNNEIFNIGAGEEFSIKFFADLICDVVGYDSTLIIYDTSRYTGAESKCLNIEKIQKVVDDYSLISLNSGVAETIRWFYDVKAFEL